MFFIVEFADGTTTQIVANDTHGAKRLAVVTFKDKLVVSVTKAGLMGLTQCQTPPIEKP
jgi:hypothetical protein